MRTTEPQTGRAELPSSIHWGGRVSWYYKYVPGSAQGWNHWKTFRNTKAYRVAHENYHSRSIGLRFRFYCTSNAPWPPCHKPSMDLGTSVSKSGPANRARKDLLTQLLWNLGQWARLATPFSADWHIGIRATSYFLSKALTALPI